MLIRLIKLFYFAGLDVFWCFCFCLCVFVVDVDCLFCCFGSFVILNCDDSSLGLFSVLLCWLWLLCLWVILGCGYFWIDFILIVYLVLRLVCIYWIVDVCCIGRLFSVLILVVWISLWFVLVRLVWLQGAVCLNVYWYWLFVLLLFELLFVVLVW